MSIKMILFDKDGTLLDFDALWVRVSRLALADLLENLQADPALLDQLLLAMGIENDHTSVQGVLCWGTYPLMGQALYRVLIDHGVPCTLGQVTALSTEGYHRYAAEGPVLPACADIRAVLTELKKSHKLAVVTSDTPAVADHCLRQLGIADCFDAVYGDDDTCPAKPDPTRIALICDAYGYSPAELVMVGDTMADMAFAKNGGIRAIGLAKTKQDSDHLAALADAVCPDISHVGKILAGWAQQ